MRNLVLVYLLSLGLVAGARVLPVGPGEEFATPSKAAAVVRDGDTVEIAAGTYARDVTAWHANNLTIRGVHGRAVLDAQGTAYGGKAIWVLQGKNTTIENIEFANCKVPDKNGAGIRQEGATLTLRHCLFRNDEDGILAGDNAESDILIEYCEFAQNGAGDGYSHNLYINHVRKLTFRYNYSHSAQVGHELKSRALENFIYCNRISDEADGTASYLIDLPNGGRSFVIGNVLQKGARAQNNVMLSYAEEGAKNPLQELYVINNTFVNSRPNGTAVRVAGTPTVLLANNLLTGGGAFLQGAGEQRNNLITNAPGFVDASNYDYRILSNSPAAGAGSDPGKAGDALLLPTEEYVHPAAKEARVNGKKIDVGAFAALAND